MSNAVNTITHCTIRSVYVVMDCLIHNEFFRIMNTLGIAQSAIRKNVFNCNNMYTMDYTIHSKSPHSSFPFSQSVIHYGICI